jgi:hypothetical protein
MRRTIVCLLALVATAVLPTTSRAQVFHGVVLDRELNRPVLVSAVTLIDFLHKVRAVGITDSAGRYELVAPGPGRYKVRADPRGYRTTYSAEYIVEAGDTVEVNVLATADTDTELTGEPTTRRRPLAPDCVPPSSRTLEKTPEECDGRWAVEVHNCFDQPINVYDGIEGETILLGEVAAFEYAVLVPRGPAKPSVSVRPLEHGANFRDRSSGLITARVYCDPYWRKPQPG